MKLATTSSSSIANQSLSKASLDAEFQYIGLLLFSYLYFFIILSVIIVATKKQRKLDLIRHTSSRYCRKPSLTDYNENEDRTRTPPRECEFPPVVEMTSPVFPYNAQNVEPIASKRVKCFERNIVSFRTFLGRDCKSAATASLPDAIVPNSHGGVNLAKPGALNSNFNSTPLPLKESCRDCKRPTEQTPL